MEGVPSEHLCGKAWVSWLTIWHWAELKSEKQGVEGRMSGIEEVLLKASEREMGMMIANDILTGCQALL